MKRLLIIYIVLSSLCLSGCKSIYNNYKEIEQLLVVQTMGLDTHGGGVILSLASAAGISTQARRLSASGDSITTAMERIYNYSYEEQLFLSHVGQLLIGEEAAEKGIGDFLSYVSRTPAMRLDMPMFIVREGKAQDAIMQVGDGKRGISEILETVEVSSNRRGDSGIYTAADVQRDLMRWGSALVCALECTEASETPEEKISPDSAPSPGEKESKRTAKQNENNQSPQLTAAAMGFAIIRDGKLCGYLSREEAIAVGFLRNDTGICDIQVEDKYGETVVLELGEGHSRIKPVWAGPGELSGLEVFVDANASVIEMEGDGELQNAEYSDHLTAQFEKKLAEYVQSTLQASKQMKADFLGLSSAVENAQPEYYRMLKRGFASILPELELKISVSARLKHTNDMRDA